MGKESRFDILISTDAELSGLQQSRNDLKGFAEAAKATGQNTDALEAELATLDQRIGQRKIDLYTQGLREMVAQTRAAGGETAELEQRLRGLESASAGAAASGTSLGAVFGGSFLAGLAQAGLEKIPEILQGSIGRGVEFNQTLEDTESAIAAVLQKFAGLSETDSTLQAASALEELKRQAINSPATIQELSEAWLASAGAASEANIPIKDQINLMVKLSQATARLNLPTQQLVQETRALLTANVTQDAALARTLGITNKQIEAAKEQGKLYEFLIGKIGALGAASDTFTVRQSNLNDAIDQLLGKATEPVFDALREGFGDLSAAIGNPEALNALRALGFEIAGLVKGGLALTEWAVRNAEVLSLVAKGTAAFGVALAAVKLKDAVGSLFQMATNLQTVGTNASSAAGSVSSMGGALNVALAAATAIAVISSQVDASFAAAQVAAQDRVKSGRELVEQLNSQVRSAQTIVEKDTARAALAKKLEEHYLGISRLDEATLGQLQTRLRLFESIVGQKRLEISAAQQLDEAQKQIEGTTKRISELQKEIAARQNLPQRGGSGALAALRDELVGSKLKFERLSLEQAAVKQGISLEDQLGKEVVKTTRLVKDQNGEWKLQEDVTSQIALKSAARESAAKLAETAQVQRLKLINEIFDATGVVIFQTGDIAVQAFGAAGNATGDAQKKLVAYGDEAAKVEDAFKTAKAARAKQEKEEQDAIQETINKIKEKLKTQGLTAPEDKKKAEQKLNNPSTPEEKLEDARIKSADTTLGEGRQKTYALVVKELEKGIEDAAQVKLDEQNAKLAAAARAGQESAELGKLQQRLADGVDVALKATIEAKIKALQAKGVEPSTKPEDKPKPFVDTIDQAQRNRELAAKSADLEKRNLPPPVVPPVAPAPVGPVAPASPVGNPQELTDAATSAAEAQKSVETAAIAGFGVMATAAAQAATSLATEAPKGALAITEVEAAAKAGIEAITQAAAGSAERLTGALDKVLSSFNAKVTALETKLLGHISNPKAHG